MAESLENSKSYIGKKHAATDVVTASAIVKFTARLGREHPGGVKGKRGDLGASEKFHGSILAGFLFERLGG